jgi:hypothetical protein
LYGDFTTPLQPGISLNIWDFVALIGQQLLGEQIQSDPIWDLLTRLAGRNEQEAPGQDFAVPEDWRLPVEWLTAFPERDSWQWTVEHERLLVKHPVEFLLLDVPLAQLDPMEQLAREMQEYKHIVGTCPLSLVGEDIVGAWACPRPLAGASPHIARWLGWLMPYVRARLCRALNLTAIDDLPRIVCEHHARVFVTATHIDIFLSLAELPIAIRFAGLDRDPGWVPAAGRFVAFHFE